MRWKCWMAKESSERSPWSNQANHTLTIRDAFWPHLSEPWKAITIWSIFHRPKSSGCTFPPLNLVRLLHWTSSKTLDEKYNFANSIVIYSFSKNQAFVPYRRKYKRTLSRLLFSISVQNKYSIPYLCSSISTQKKQPYVSTNKKKRPFFSTKKCHSFQPKKRLFVSTKKKANRHIK